MCFYKDTTPHKVIKIISTIPLPIIKSPPLQISYLQRFIQNYYYIPMGSAFLTQPNKTKQLTKHQHGKLRVVTCEMQGWRKHMQDAVVFHRINKDIFLFAVFDGHGGVEVSKYCARHLPETVQNNAAFQRGDYETALEEVFFQLDKMMTSENGEKLLQQITIEHGMQPFDSESSKVSDSVGCTANVALLVGKKLYVANAGDSRCALSRLGSVIELSFDHKPQNPLELERIVSSGSKVENGRINNHLNLSRSLGDHHYKKNNEVEYHRQTITGHPDIKTVELCRDDDFIIMGCDGIWQRYQKNPQGLIDLIRSERMKGKAPQTVLEQMLDGFLGKDPNTQQLGCDNMSVILIELNKNAFA